MPEPNRGQEALNEWFKGGAEGERNQTKLAALLGVKQQTVSGWASEGQVPGSPRVLIGLQVYCGIPISWWQEPAILMRRAPEAPPEASAPRAPAPPPDDPDARG